VTVDPWAWWTAEEIAAAAECPLENVREHWPRIFEQLGHGEIQTPNIATGVIGTIAIETASTFAPVREGCYLGEPEPAETHRATLSYWPYYGRGYIQLTHASNYSLYGPKVAELWGTSPDDAAFDLVANPDAALEPNMAAAIIALWFRDTRALPTDSYPAGYTLVEACELQDWEWVRILVYGGSDPVGAARIGDIAAALGPPSATSDGSEASIVPEPELPLPSYDQMFPAFAQNDDWSCAPTSARWALWAYSEDSTEQWVEGTMLAEDVVTTKYGLSDSTGAGLADFLNRHYGEYGYLASNSSYVLFDEVAQEAGAARHPLMLGGQAWCHWSGVRGFDGTRLVLANPAPGWHGVNQHMSRDQFTALGKMSLVRLTHPAAEAIAPPEPGPTPDPNDPYAPWRGAVGSGLLDMMAADGVLPAQRSSTWLPLGVSPADVESCAGQNGTEYRWLLTVSHGYRYRPSA
jgi:hypothetical protein